MMQRRMLTVEESAGPDTEVRREDQDAINRFSRLHQRSLIVRDDINAAHKVRDEYEEVRSELELSLDEDEKIPYRIGDCFVQLKIKKVQSLLDRETKRQSEEIQKLEHQKDELEDEMKALKARLYARFGTSINLEA